MTQCVPVHWCFFFGFLASASSLIASRSHSISSPGKVQLPKLNFFRGSAWGRKIWEVSPLSFQKIKLKSLLSTPSLENNNGEVSFCRLVGYNFRSYFTLEVVLKQEDSAVIDFVSLQSGKTHEIKSWAFFGSFITFNFSVF